MPTLVISQPCIHCGAGTLVRCASCRQICCLDHLTKIQGGGQSVMGLCGDCEAIYAGNPACYGPLNRLGGWTPEERAHYGSPPAADAT